VLIFCCSVYVMGCLLMLFSSLPVALEHGAGLGGLIGSMILIGLGVGAVKATFFPFLGTFSLPRKCI
jgi:POT family proton-dependent oligopeptide transporter